MNNKDRMQNDGVPPKQDSVAGRFTQSAGCSLASANGGCPSADNGRSGSIQQSTIPSIRRPRPPRAPYRHRNHRRTGKVARLPAAIRNEICLMFTRYAEYKDIIAWLASQGHPNISESNLSRWRKGGFQEWLRKEQEKRVDLITMALDVLTELVKEEKKAGIAAAARESATASSSNGGTSVPASHGPTDPGPLTTDLSSAHGSHQSNNPQIHHSAVPISPFIQQSTNPKSEPST